MAGHLAYLSVGAVTELQRSCALGQGPVRVAAVSKRFVHVVYLLVSVPIPLEEHLDMGPEIPAAKLYIIYGITTPTP